MNGRRRCDDMKAQLDTVSDQIKQAERAQHEKQHELPAAAAPAGTASASSGYAKPRKSRSTSPELNPRSDSPAGQPNEPAARAPSGHQDQKRKRDLDKSPDPGDDLGSKEDREQARERATQREGVKKASKQLPAKKLSKKVPDGKKRKHAAGDIPAETARGRHSPDDKEEEEEGVASKEGTSGMEASRELPQLKKKRHLLYKQLQEAKQQVAPCCCINLVFLVYLYCHFYYLLVWNLWSLESLPTQLRSHCCCSVQLYFFQSFLLCVYAGYQLWLLDLLCRM